MATTNTARAAEHERMPGHWSLVIVLMAIYTYAFIDRVILALLVEPIKADLGASDVEMGLMLGLAFALFYGIFSIPAGHFVDRLNRRRLIAIASVVWALMTIVCGMSQTLTQLFVGRMGVGVAESVLAPAAFSLIRDAVPGRSRGLAFSIFAMAPLLGGAASLIGGSALLDAIEGGAFVGLPLLGELKPWQGTLVVVGLCGLPFSLLLLLMAEPTRSVQPKQSSKASSSMVVELLAACRYMVGRKSIYLPLVLFATFSAMISLSKSAWMPTAFGRQWKMAPQEVGPTLGILTLVCGVLGLIIAGALMNRITQRGGDIRRFGALAVALTAIGIVGAMFAPTLTLAYMFVAFGLFFLGTSYAVGATTLAEATPIDVMGRVSSVYLLFQNLVGQTLGPLIVALVSTNVFAGPFALPRALAVSVVVFAIATVLSALALGNAIRRSPVGAGVSSG